MFRSSGLALVAIAIVVGAALACGTDQENVCESTGDCEQGGSSDWIDGCKEEAKLLKTEAQANGCGAALDDYYSCAYDNFECHGASASFPGCEGKLGTLNACLDKAIDKTACGALRDKTKVCPAPDASADAGTTDADASAATPPACTASRDCHSQCFLDNVKNACAAAIDELTSFATCAGRCPID